MLGESGGEFELTALGLQKSIHFGYTSMVYDAILNGLKRAGGFLR